MTPEAQLDAFLARYDDAVAADARAALAIVRERVPGAVEMVYDNYNALVIGFGPDEKASHAVFSLALYPRYVTLFFLQGRGLPDPDGWLEGSGAKVRRITLKSLAVLDEPAVIALMHAAVDAAFVPIDAASPRRMVIKSVSPKQRPRRPASVDRRGSQG